MKNFISRFFTGLVLLVVILAIIFGSREGLFVMNAVVSSIAVTELLTAFQKAKYRPDLPSALVANLLLQWCAYQYSFEGMFLVSVVMLMVCLLRITFDREISLMDGISSLFAFFYISGLLSFLLLYPDAYQEYVLLVFAAAWGTDTFAYVGGMLLGHHPLCPTISPKKTVEGSISGMIGALAVAAGFRCFFFSELQIVHVLLAVFIGSVASQAGDLCASRFKREVGIKDYGNLLSGHGGILDRFDSVLFAAPTVWALLKLFG
ncbi:MAG: phosphatidate cytidylyltransferase [Ndongobacter sp.]|nr:phosphatidate cytidylyltransferase [Ndongobacter sp.]